MAEDGRNPDRLVLDPVHGYIHIPGALQRVVDLPIMQRLRRTSQTALVATVYPAANGTRFEHALGAMHLASYAFERAWANSQRLHREIARRVIKDTSVADRSDQAWADLLGTATAAVALLHDVGHPPFSHALEEIYREYSNIIFSDADATRGRLDSALARQFHEVAGEILVETIARELNDEALRIVTLRVYSASEDDGGWAGALKSITSGELDVDRLDYLMRDAHHMGTEYGAIDWRRLLDALEFHIVDNQIRLGPGIRARSAAETLLVQRAQAYKWVYHHHRVVAVELFLRRAVGTLLSLQDSQQQITVAGTSTTLGALIRTMAPNLNFLVATDTSLSRAIDFVGIPNQLSGSPVELLPLDQDIWHRLAGSLFPEIQASTDDAMIVSTLRRFAFVFSYLRAQTPDEHSDEVDRFFHYYRAALLRRGSFLTAWKRYEEYAGVARQLVEEFDLLKSVRVAFQVVTASETRSGRLEALGVMQESYECATPVALLNRLASLLVRSSDPSLPDFLDSMHESPVEGVFGFWEAAYRDLSAISTKGLCSVVWEQGKSVPLHSTSPLVAALPTVEDERIKFFLYFMRTGSDRPDTSSESSTFRREMREAFMKSFPVFVRDNLPMALRETVFLDVDVSPVAKNDG